MQPNPTPGSAREFLPVYVYAVIENILFFRWEVVYFFADYFPFPVVTMIFLTGLIISSLGKPIHDSFPCLAREKMPHKEEGSTSSIYKIQLQNTQAALMVVELRECPTRPETQANNFEN